MHRLLYTLLLAPSVALAVPLAFNHQGRLHDASGVPLSGTHDLSFAIYDSPTGSTALWSETISTSFSSGYFSVQLGSTAPLDAADFDGSSRYLGIAVDSGAELPTRHQLVTVPFALRALNATDAAHADSADSADVATAVSGGVVDATELRINGDTVIDADGVVADALPSGTGMPTGAVMPFVTTTCPAGFIPADGTTYTAAEQPGLSALSGGGPFTTPDLRGEFVRGADDGRGVDPGRSVASAQSQDFKSFSVSNGEGGTFSYTHSPVPIEKSGTSTGRVYGGYFAAPATIIRFTWDDSEIRPRNVALLYCIKT